VRVHILDECTSRGTLREEGLAAAPQLLRVQLQGQDGRDAAEPARAAARGEEREAAAIARGGLQRKAGTAAPVSTVKKVELKKKKLRRRARRENR